MRIILFVLLALTLSSCAGVSQQTETSKKQPNPEALIKLSNVKNSHFKQVEAQFTTQQNKLLVFKVLSDLHLTTQWFDKLLSIQTLAQYNNNQFLTRSIIDSPWPIQNRELITCVNTRFDQKVISIEISACSERAKTSPDLVRITSARSSWTITERDNNLTQIDYKAWIDPAGNIPALFFNYQLISSTKRTLNRLQTILNQANIKNYAY